MTGTQLFFIGMWAGIIYATITGIVMNVIVRKYRERRRK